MRSMLARSLPAPRRQLFDALWREVESHCSLANIASPQQRERGHQIWIWDATLLPTRSHYVPVFLQIIESLEASGELDPSSDILVETTTGNAGSAVAYVAARLGYPVLVFMPEDMPEARLQDVRNHLSDASELRLTSSGKYVQGAVEALRSFLSAHREEYKGRRVRAIDHSRRPEAIEAIAMCLTDAIEERNTKVDVGVAALGNGTSLSGMARALNVTNPDARIVGIEPFESPCVYVAKYGADRFCREYGVEPSFSPHRLLGTGGWGVRFPHMDIDAIYDVHPIAENSWKRTLAGLVARGLPVGHSSAACMHVIDELAETSTSPLSFLSIFYDTLDKYVEAS